MSFVRPRWSPVLVCILVFAVAPLRAADNNAPRTREQMKAAFDAHKGDFDYLLGDWQYTSENQQWGKGHGTWSAIRLGDGQVLDEFKVLGDKGEVYYSSVTLRSYNAMKDQWELVMADTGTGLQNVGTARKEAGEIQGYSVRAEPSIEQQSGGATEPPSLSRIRYYNIGADRFSWSADRSTDGGKTWIKDFQRIEARRVGPPHATGPFAAAKK